RTGGGGGRPLRPCPLQPLQPASRARRQSHPTSCGRSTSCRVRRGDGVAVFLPCNGTHTTTAAASLSVPCLPPPLPWRTSGLRAVPWERCSVFPDERSANHGLPLRPVRRSFAHRLSPAGCRTAPA